MKEENYWQQFLRTGRVDDYLSYLKQKRPADGAGTPADEGDYSGAGALQRYGNDIEGGTFRGI